jgi:predicted transcriptional regulator
VVARPVGEDFPRADGVEFFHTVEQQDPDVLRRCSHALIKADTTSEIAKLLRISRSTVYRAVKRAAKAKLAPTS